MRSATQLLRAVAKAITDASLIALVLGGLILLAILQGIAGEESPL